MKCGIGTDDYNKQKDFVDRLCWVAKSENIHIHLIHHVRKGGSERERPGKFDIKGAGEITDLVDNVFIQWRNKGKEEKVKMREAGQAVDLDDDEADAILTVAKQRHGEWEGPLKLWFHAPSQQFIPKSCNSPMPFTLESA
jgi:twinkle protein